MYWRIFSSSLVASAREVKLQRKNASNLTLDNLGTAVTVNLALLWDILILELSVNVDNYMPYRDIAYNYPH